MEEKRKSARFKLNQLLACTTEGEEFRRADAIDLSKGGVKCSSAQPIEPMTSVYLILKVPKADGTGERDINCEGYVSHSCMTEGKCVFGIRFTGIEEEGKADFDVFLASLASETPAAP